MAKRSAPTKLCSSESTGDGGIASGKANGPIATADEQTRSGSWRRGAAPRTTPGALKTVVTNLQHAAAKRKSRSGDTDAVERANRLRRSQATKKHKKRSAQSLSSVLSTNRATAEFRLRHTQ
ncbi:hypothetical protein CATMIT_01910, partial [Catenibacterium mitsuokai DSM 15897]